MLLRFPTLATEGSFAFIRERLGYGDARELQVPSPFDYASHALLYLADDIPEPGSPGYQKRLNDALIELGTATEGRALVLFTSHNALQTTYRAIKPQLERAGILVLGQRIDGNPRQLLDRFRANPRAMLLGTSSFWEGVDVVGEALSALVITKLPFAVPTDPVFAARSERFEDPFLGYAVPGAILRFKQGFGRLIRSAEDRGVCVILDRRVLSKRYGRAFKAGTNLTVGSPATLLANLLDERGFEVELYDPHVDEGPCPFTEPGVYFVATRHDEFAQPDWQFPAGSIVLDPWRYVPARDSVEIVPVGVGTGGSLAEAVDELKALASRNGNGAHRNALAFDES